MSKFAVGIGSANQGLTSGMAGDSTEAAAAATAASIQQAAALAGVSAPIAISQADGARLAPKLEANILKWDDQGSVDTKRAMELLKMLRTIGLSAAEVGEFAKLNAKHKDEI